MCPLEKSNNVGSQLSVITQEIFNYHRLDWVCLSIALFASLFISFFFFFNVKVNTGKLEANFVR